MVFIFSFYFYLDTWVTTQKIAGRSIYIGSKSDKPWSTLVEEGKERYRPPGKSKQTFMFIDYAAYQVGR